MYHPGHNFFSGIEKKEKLPGKNIKYIENNLFV
jgi:hypothetical protein